VKKNALQVKYDDGAEEDEDAAGRRSATSDKYWLPAEAASSASPAYVKMCAVLSGNLASGHVRGSPSAPLNTSWDEWPPAARGQAAGPQQPSEPPPRWDKPKSIAPWHKPHSWRRNEEPEWQVQWQRQVWQYVSRSDQRHSMAVTTLANWEHGPPASTPIVVDDSESEPLDSEDGRWRPAAPAVGVLDWSVDWDEARTSPQKRPSKDAHTEPEGEARRRWCDHPPDDCSEPGPHDDWGHSMRWIE